MIRTRIPPSPTGRFHIGTARTALFNYLYAKKNGGEFLFRIEDTDRERSAKEHEEDIIEGLKWLGLGYDGEIVHQSERLARHQELLQKLVAEDKAYISKEPSAKEPGTEVEVVRLRNEGRSITFADEIRGSITFDTTELGDFVIGRRIDDPLYHFAVVVDDSDMGITHVIRGEDHISNTPRQILIQEALGIERPVYAHLPLILAPDRSKLSKRHGAVSLLEYRNEGFLPEAVINYLALLGWTPPVENERLTLEELIPLFELSAVHKGGAVFDRMKFLSVNQGWMRSRTDDAFISEGGIDIPGDAPTETILPLLKERAQTYGEAREMITGELAFLFKEPTVEKVALIAKEKVEGETQKHLTKIIELLSALPKETDAESVKTRVMPYADTEGRGQVLWPMRYGLSGQERSPDPFTITAILGPETAVSRLQKALAIL